MMALDAAVSVFTMLCAIGFFVLGLRHDDGDLIGAAVVAAFCSVAFAVLAWLGGS